MPRTCTAPSNTIPFGTLCFSAALTLTLLAGTSQAQVAAPSLADAKKAIAAAQAAATKMGTNLSCVVIDARGAVVAAERMDGAPFFTVDAARSKALVSASLGAPSGALASLATSGLGAVLPGPATPLFMQGAVPLKKGAATIGAIGCSGGAAQQDEDGAKAGAATLP